jgi:hypothetical protein
MKSPSSPSLWQRPNARLGWWAVDLMVGYLAMFVGNRQGTRLPKEGRFHKARGVPVMAQ